MIAKMNVVCLKNLKTVFVLEIKLSFVYRKHMELRHFIILLPK